MNSAINFVVDQVNKGRIYPALATHQARPYTQAWREFGQHWPFTTPVRMQEYCEQHQVAITLCSADNVIEPAFYPICLGFFDFGIDYFSLLPPSIFDLVLQSKLTILFLYHEGDNPRLIKSRLDALCVQHGLHTGCYVFVSANTSADKLPGFVAFHDFELWYYQRNLNIAPTAIHNKLRSKDFTALVRTHKWWRAVAMADLCRRNLLDNSYWSYCETAPNSHFDDCPIEVDLIPQLRWYVNKFCTRLPHHSDDLSQDERNNHAVTQTAYHSNAYCNIVFESQFDVDGSGGAFLTEKIFKPIKHGQMFFVAGAAGSLQALRDLGYEVFDGILDNTYDLEHNATRRWIKLCESIAKSQPHLHSLHNQAIPMLQHNQNLFLSDKSSRLNTLIEKIHAQYR